MEPQTGHWATASRSSAGQTDEFFRSDSLVMASWFSDDERAVKIDVYSVLIVINGAFRRNFPEKRELI